MIDIDELDTCTLLTLLNKKMYKSIKKGCLERGINLSYAQIIFEMSKCCNKKYTQNDIATSLHLSKPTISLTLKNMEEEGYITRTQDEEDSRKTIVKLAVKGIELKEELICNFVDIQTKALSNITKEELEFYNKITIKMISNLEEIK